MGSRLLPLGLALSALVAGAAHLPGLALYLGLLTIPFAAGAAFVAVSDLLEGRRALLRAVTTGLALTLVVAASAVRENAAHGSAAPPFATYALVGALLAYLLPTVAWLFEPVRLPRAREPRPAPVRVTHS
ncbi:MAG TPA: hypothetical protein VFJ77_10590 [Gaiellaceae bacterium]|nr:hypothetical protein [Gaiellaceae bacterium]